MVRGTLCNFSKRIRIKYFLLKSLISEVREYQLHIHTPNVKIIDFGTGGVEARLATVFKSFIRYEFTIKHSAKTITHITDL